MCSGLAKILVLFHDFFLINTTSSRVPKKSWAREIPPPPKKNTKKNQFFDNVEEPFAQGSKKVEILKSFICYFSRCSLQPASCIKMVDWAVENNYVQDHVLFFPSILPFAKQRQFITLLCCSLAFLVVMKTLSQVGLLLIFELRTEIWNWYWDRLALYKY